MYRLLLDFIVRTVSAINFKEMRRDGGAEFRFGRFLAESTRHPARARVGAPRNRAEAHLPQVQSPPDFIQLSLSSRRLTSTL